MKIDYFLTLPKLTRAAVIQSGFKGVVLYTLIALRFYISPGNSVNGNSKMISITRPVSAGQFRSSALVLLLWVAVFCPATGFAVVVEGLFDVDIPVPDESRSIRQAALADGLAEVLVRVSGDRDILQKVKLPSITTFVKQFRYIPVEPGTPKANQQDQQSASHILSVQYNPTQIMNLLRKNAIPIWGEHRNQVVIWLAVRDGTNQYILRDRDTSLIKTQANNSLQRRGVPVIWPRNDSRDQRQLIFADVWAGFAKPIQQASKRYSTGPVVSASMAWNGKAWVGDWSVFLGRDSRRWTLEDQDYNAMIALAIDVIADAIGQKFAVLEATDVEGLNQVFVEIDQVESVRDFRHVQDYLTSLPVVQSVRLSQVEPERVAFKLILRSEVDDFLRLIKADTKMIPLVTADAEAVTGLANTVYRFKLLN